VSTPDLKAWIRDVPDFPKAGVTFKDITPLLADPTAFRRSIELLAERVLPHDIGGLVAIESRGFLFGAALAQRHGLPLAIVRKPGKLPFRTHRISYELEYGSSVLEVHTDAIQPGRRYAVIDDVLATGGTAAATAELVRRLGGEVACHGFLIELSFLQGRGRLGGTAAESLLFY
jgi:adenine phosphoribosyltransferase